MTKQKYCFRN